MLASFVSSTKAQSPTPIIPLNDLGTGLYLNQFQGGLYPNGSSVVPATHAAAGLARAAAIQPLNTVGIQAQINQMNGGGIDPLAGDLNYNNGVVPSLAWGPYTWADGLNPRSDGLTWERSDFVNDGTHPSQSGETKVGNMLLDFCSNSEFTQPWFVALLGDYNKKAVSMRLTTSCGAMIRIARRLNTMCGERISAGR